MRRRQAVVLLLIPLLLMAVGCASLQSHLQAAETRLKADGQEMVQQLKGAGQALVASTLEQTKEQLPQLTAKLMQSVQAKAPDIISAIIDKNKDKAIAAIKQIGQQAQDAAVASVAGIVRGVGTTLDQQVQAAADKVKNLGVDPALIAKIKEAPTAANLAAAYKAIKDKGGTDWTAIGGLAAILATGGGGLAVLKKKISSLEKTIGVVANPSAPAASPSAAPATA